ncbi:hypothetical protein PRIC1_004682 [Phytophthora ramorum]
MDISLLLNETSEEATSDVGDTAASPIIAPPEGPSSYAPFTEIRAPESFFVLSYEPLTSTSGSNDTPNAEEWSKWNCNQIRAKICKFLGTKELTQAAFLDLLDIDSKSFRKFMGMSGPRAGEDNFTYDGASIFFYMKEKKAKQDMEKMKTMDPKARKRKAAEQKEVKAKMAKRSNAGEDLLRRIEEVKLPDMDENGSAPVYDDCDGIRRKINFFLNEGLVSKAAFLRALGDVNSNSLRNFMSLTRQSGVRNVVYRTAYVFFEKKRILDGKEKTKERLRNEDIQGPGGFPVHGGTNLYVIDRYIELHGSKGRRNDS